MHSNYMALRTSYKWIIACFFPSQPKGFWKSNFLITLEDIWRRKKKATCSLHTKCGRVDASFTISQTLEAPRSHPQAAACSLCETATSVPWRAATRQTSITLSWMTLLPSLLQVTISLSQTCQNPQEHHPVCCLVFLLIHLSNASSWVKGAALGEGGIL